MPALPVLHRPAAAVSAAAAVNPGSPTGVRLPDRTSVAAAAKRHRRRGSRCQLRNIVSTIGQRAQAMHAGDRAEIELAIEMRKQFVVARRLPTQRVPQRVGIDLDQEQSGLAEEMLSGGLRYLLGKRKMNKPVA